MGKIAILKSLIVLYEESRELTSIEDEFYVLELTDKIAEKFGVYDEYMNLIKDTDEN